MIILLQSDKNEVCPRNKFQLNENLYLLSQTTLASSVCLQSCFQSPLWGQLNRLVSVPVHFSSSKMISPPPNPNLLSALPNACRAEGYPSILQATWASFRSNLSSQTVPHLPLLLSSILPSFLVFPPDKRTVTIQL